MRSHALLLLIPVCTLFSCASPASSSSPQKGEEKVTTISEYAFTNAITNAGLVSTPQADVTIKYESSEGQTSIIKIFHFAVEFDMEYPGGGLKPMKYYSIDTDKADLYVINPATGGVASHTHVTHDEAMKDVIDAVGILGSGFAYSAFTYNSSSKSYHADLVKASSGFDLANVDLYFENEVLQKATGTEKTDEGDCTFTITCYDYGKTEVYMPY